MHHVIRAYNIGCHFTEVQKFVRKHAMRGNPNNSDNCANSLPYFQISTENMTGNHRLKTMLLKLRPVR